MRDRPGMRARCFLSGCCLRMSVRDRHKGRLAMNPIVGGHVYCESLTCLRIAASTMPSISPRDAPSRKKLVVW